MDANRPDHPNATDASAIRLRLRLFGQMDARSGEGASVLPRVRKTRAVLALLALAAPRRMLRQTVAELLWSRRDRDQARASLRQAMHDLHEQLAPVGQDLIFASREHIGLQSDTMWIDAREVMNATRANPSALSLVQGMLLEDLVGIDPAFDRWLDAQRHQLLSVARQVAEVVLGEQNEPGSIIAAAEQILSIDRTHEGGWRALMQAHARRGERSLALDAFDRCTAALAELARTQPSQETQAIYAAIRNPGVVPAVESALSLPQHRTRGVRLGVLPFRSLDVGQDDHLGLGMAEEITTSLSVFRMITLLSSTSLAHVAMADGDLQAALQQLDLDFVVVGNVQRCQGRVRVLARLLDVRAGGEVVWARRFDRDAIDALALQDDIASEIAAQIDPELLLREGLRAVSHPNVDPKAYDLTLRAIPSIYHLDREHFMAAGDALAEAVRCDPSYPAAHAWWAYWHVFLVGQGWASDPEHAIQLAGDLSERAIMLDATDARALTIAGHVRSFLHRQHQKALALHDRALSLNPNLPIAWVFSGLTQTYLGRHDEAIRRIMQAKRLSPFDPHTFFFDSALMIPHLLRGDFEIAVEICQRVTEVHRGLSTSFKGYLTALGHLGRLDEAGVVRERLLRLEPQFTVTDALTRSPLLREEDRDIYAAGLRLAGLPE